MIKKATIQALIDESMKDSDLFLVELDVKPGNLISVIIDSDSGTSIEKCMKVSRGVEHNLDREEEDFELRVSSAGLDQPFKVHRQYVKNIGREVVVKLNEGGSIEGVLEEVAEDNIVVKTKSKERIEGRKAKQWVEESHTLNFSDIAQTKVVILFNKKK